MSSKLMLEAAIIGLTVAGIVACALALAFHDWLDTPYFTVGLWKGCVEGTCVEWPVEQVPDWLQAVRAFAFLGLFAMFGAMVASVLHAFVIKDNKVFLIFTICLSLFAGLFMMIAFAIFTDKSDISSYGAGFGLCISGWLVGWLVAGLSVGVFVLERTGNAIVKS